jgi:hypothetical protein
MGHLTFDTPRFINFYVKPVELFTIWLFKW